MALVVSVKQGYSIPIGGVEYYVGSIVSPDLFFVTDVLKDPEKYIITSSAWEEVAPGVELMAGSRVYGSKTWVKLLIKAPRSIDIGKLRKGVAKVVET